MKLKPKKVVLKPVKQEVEPPKKQTKKREKNTLPSDEYQPMFTPIRFLVRETFSSKNGSKVKQYLELSVMRFGDDDENAPMVYIQMYQESEFYTGYLKGKCVYLPLEMLYDLMDELTNLSELADEHNIQ